MGIWDKFFGKKTENNSEKSPYLPSEEIEIDIQFAEAFTKKGGRFLFCESSRLVSLNLIEIFKDDLEVILGKRPFKTNSEKIEEAKLLKNK